MKILCLPPLAMLLKLVCLANGISVYGDGLAASEARYDHEIAKRQKEIRSLNEWLVREIRQLELPKTISFESREARILEMAARMRIDNADVVEKLFAHMDTRYDPVTIPVGATMPAGFQFPAAYALSEIRPDISRMATAVSAAREMERMRIAAWIMIKCTSLEVAKFVFTKTPPYATMQEHEKIPVILEALDKASKEGLAF